MKITHHRNLKFKFNWTLHIDETWSVVMYYCGKRTKAEACVGIDSKAIDIIYHGQRISVYSKTKDVEKNMDFAEDIMLMMHNYCNLTAFI